MSQGKNKKKHPKGAMLQDDSPMQHMLPDNVASKLSEHEVLTLFEKMLVSDNYCLIMASQNVPPSSRIKRGFIACSKASYSLNLPVHVNFELYRSCVA